MYTRKWSKQACITWMLLAITALGLGQVLGVILTPKEENIPEAEVSEEALVLTGTVILQQELIYAPQAGFWTRTASQGKVSPGQPLFTGPVSTADAANRAALLSGAMEAEALALPRRRESLHRAIGGLSTGETDMVEVMALVLEGVSQESLSEAAAQLSALTVQCEKITAPAGGIFIAEAQDQVLGRIVTSEDWQLSLFLPFAVSVGDRISAELLSGIFREATFTVEEAQITPGGCQALLRCEQHLFDAAKIRNLTVKISL